MSDITRKLATIERILDIQPHSNADKLEIATVRGWQIVVQKDLYHVGEQIVFFEVDSFIPAGNPELEFLRKNCFRSNVLLGDGFKIKTIKLRGEISQGLIAPLDDFPEFAYIVADVAWCDLTKDFTTHLLDGDDVTETLGVKLWEVPIHPALSGKVKGNFPTSLVPKTDQPRYQNLGRLIADHENDEFEVTVKMDGSSMTIIWMDGEFRVCSRNLELEETDDNIYWKVALKTGLKEALLDGYDNCGCRGNMAFQGELVGPGIQGNPHKLKEHSFYIFDIYYIDGQTYFPAIRRIEIIEGFKELYNLDLKHVPIIATIDKYPNKGDIKKLIGLRNGVIDEGFVFKSVNDSSFSFKYVNPEYDLNKD